MTETGILEAVTGGSEGVAAVGLFAALYYIRLAVGELRKAREAWEKIAGRDKST